MRCSVEIGKEQRGSVPNSVLKCQWRESDLSDSPAGNVFQTLGRKTEKERAP